jgi:hypothetical protein
MLFCIWEITFFKFGSICTVAVYTVAKKCSGRANVFASPGEWYKFYVL